MRIDIITIFPGLFPGFLTESLLGRAIESGLVDVRIHDLRDWSLDTHRSVDDASFGGGPGMVLRAEPLFAAVESLDPDRGRVLALSPSGRSLRGRGSGGRFGGNDVVHRRSAPGES